MSSRPPGTAERLKAGEPVFGERLSAVGPGPLTVPEAEEVLEGTSAAGERHHVVFVPSIPRALPAALARQLNRLAGEGRPADADATGAAEVEIDQWRFVQVSTEKQDSPSGGPQRVTVVVREEPDLATWKRLLIELGPRLTGVYRAEEDRVEQLEIPSELRRTPAPSTRPTA